MKTLVSLLATVSAASAHTIFCQLEAGGTTYPVSYGIRTPSYDGPITDVTSDSLACNGDPNPTMDTPYIIDVAAGETVTAIWRHTLQSGSDDVMDSSHKGPTLAYLKKVDDAVNDSGIGDGWFKIQEDGYNGGDWGTLTVINNGGNHYITIPDCLPDGQYLLRAEMIALHAAGSTAGAQLYMECAQIRITGGSGSASPPTVSLPGEYSASDPGLLINIYSMTESSTYVIPGPDVFTCGAGGSTSTGTTAVPTTTLVTSTTSSSTSAAASTTSSSSTNCAAKWGQCGGSGWAGPTCCASGSTCVVTNEWYSQCL